MSDTRVTDTMIESFRRWYRDHVGKMVTRANAKKAIMSTLPPLVEVDGYTIAEIDEAMRVIGGEHTVRIGDSSWSRPLTMLSVASKAWIEGWPEDRHAAILRSALLDLNRKGMLFPKDGVWPDE